MSRIALQVSVRAATAAGLAVAIAHVLGFDFPIYALITAILVTDLSGRTDAAVGRAAACGNHLGRRVRSTHSDAWKLKAVPPSMFDGRTNGFCKLIVNRQTRGILGCHVVGERAVEITQLAAVAIAARMRVDELAHVPLSFPTYAGVLGRVAASITRQLNVSVEWQANQVEEL